MPNNKKLKISGRNRYAIANFLLVHNYLHLPLSETRIMFPLPFPKNIIEKPPFLPGCTVSSIGIGPAYLPTGQSARGGSSWPLASWAALSLD